MKTLHADGRSFLVLVLVVSSCRREEAPRDMAPLVAAPSDGQSASDPRAPKPRPPGEKTISAADLVPIETIALGFAATKSPAFRSVPVGKPKVLFSAPHLELVGDGPLTATRVMVRVKDGPEYEARTIEAHLVDLDTGSVGKYRASSRWRAPQLGLTFVWLGDGNDADRNLLHASDGVVVPLFQNFGPKNVEVVVNPGVGDGWVLERDPRQPDAAGRYGHWTDLRQPPPRPDRELPFSPWVRSHEGGTSGDKPYVSRARLPSSRDPGAVNPVLVKADRDDADACTRIELLPSGDHRCIEWIQALGGGWRVGIEDDHPVFSNVDTNEVQHLSLAEHCGPFGEDAIPTTDRAEYDAIGFTYDPPRVLLACARADAEILWSPEVTVTIPVELPADERRGWWTRDHSLRADAVKRDDDLVHERWVDLARMRVVRTPPLSDASTPYGARSILASLAATPRTLWWVDFDAASTVAVSSHRCASVAAENGDDGAWLLGCEKQDRSVLWTEVVRTADRTRHRLPAVQGTWGRRVWVADGGRRAVAILRRGGSDVLVSWTLG